MQELRRHPREGSGIPPFAQGPVTTTSFVVCSTGVVPAPEKKRGFTPFGGALRLYRGLDDWPAATDLCCWHCTEPFPGAPCTIPTRANSGDNPWEVLGCFCSWSCAKRWSLDRATFSTGVRLSWLGQLAAEFGCTAHIVAAPPMVALDKFGGPLTLAQFREGCAAIVDAPVAALERPFISYPLVLRGLECPEYNQRTNHTFAPGKVTGLRRPSVSRAVPPPAPAARMREGLYAKYLRENEQAPRAAAGAPPKKRRRGEPRGVAAAGRRSRGLANYVVKRSAEQPKKKK